LAFRVRAEGFRTLLQPLSRVVHHEGITSGTDITKGTKAYQVRNQGVFFERWRDTLDAHRQNGEAPELEKDRSVHGHILVIDHITPESDKDAGSITCIEILKALSRKRFKVIFVPETNFAFMPGATEELQRLGVECIYGPYYRTVGEVLDRYKGVLDAAFIFRAPVAERCMKYFDEMVPDLPIVFHTTDLHYLREQREAALATRALRPLSEASARRTKSHELATVRRADVTIVHSPHEQDVLSKDVPGANLLVLPWILDPKPSHAGFEARSDIAFIGGYRHAPNADAVHYFVRDIWPRIRTRIPEARFRIVGSYPPESFMSYNGVDGVLVDGYVKDLDSLLEQTRLTVAPLRYGAGIKGKVAMSLSRGVPCIATSVAAEGMDLCNGENILVADGDAEFADAVVRLYQDEARWSSISRNGVAFVAEKYSREAGEKTVVTALELARKIRTGRGTQPKAEKAVERVQ